MIEGLQYDWIYHEHIYYYSLLSLEYHFKKHGLRVFDVRPVQTHGGSMRYFICKDDREEHLSVQDLRDKEKEKRLDSWETYTDFSLRIESHCNELKRMLGDKKVVGYGASGRANAMIQYCGLNMDYIVDDAPAKHGFYTPGSHIKIYNRHKLEESPPDQILVFAWGYLNEITKKCDLPMLVPFPNPRVIKKRIN